MNLIATSYPVLDAFLTILWFFLFVIWLYILFTILIDIFRSSDLSGWGKALWFLLVLFLPLIGVLTYLIVRGGKMHERALQSARAQDEAFRSYVRDAAGAPADQVAKLAELKDRGVISEDEFQREKAKLLS